MDRCTIAFRGQGVGQLSENKQRHDEFTRLIAQSARRRGLPERLLKKANLTAFGRAFKNRLRDPGSNLAKGYVRAFVDRVTVGEQEIRIEGSKAALLEATADPKAFLNGEVPSSVRDR